MKHVAREETNDKRAETITAAETMSGKILLMQPIYKGKRNRSLLTVEFSSDFPWDEFKV